ncbi:MAG: threonylcarbamoyl-AMP synthase [Streptosporangiales bacterium]|nr:threonylcarbamoyl-AMP synthase [Streptosporangiales bacterium]MBO0891717.1 threonylcarbamoyl-AMP synthase [Acidothermales bacterium]
MSRTYNCDEPESRATGIREAADAVRLGQLVVLPTDTVYGLGADAFDPEAVGALLAAKARGRDMPVPVLVSSETMLAGIVADLPEAASRLADEFWPGGLTIIVRHQPSLAWDLGESLGTVAVRMPAHPVALELITETGPLAVSSANISGSPPATTVDEAHDQLGGSVSVYLDGGECAESVPSTIVDLTGDAPVVRREGAIDAEELRKALPDLDAGAESDA